MKTKVITVALAIVLAFVGCNQPKPEPKPDKPGYALVEFEFPNHIFSDVAEIHITDIQIVNILDNEKYPNGSFTLGEARKIVPQDIHSIVGGTEMYMGGFFPSIEYFDSNFNSNGDAFIAIRFYITIDGVLAQYERYAVRKLPYTTKFETERSYKYFITIDDRIGGSVIDVELELAE